MGAGAVSALPPPVLAKPFDLQELRLPGDAVWEGVLTLRREGEPHPGHHMAGPWGPFDVQLRFELFGLASAAGTLPI